MKDFDIVEIEYMAKHFRPNPTENQLLDDRYNWQKNQNGSEWPYYRFFYYLAQWLQPDLVLELGAYQGTAAAHFAAGFPDGVVITIDHHSDLGDDDNQLKVLEAQDTFSNLIYHQGWTADELAGALQKGRHYLGDVDSAYPRVLDYVERNGQKIDILFIDSWHCFEYAMLDYTTYRPLLNSPALVICDDIQDGGGPESPIQGMMQFWNEMPNPKFLNANLHPGTNLGFVKI